ncbi:hypothetical protein COHA_010063 [Chlorella ohadii]|uniref:Uncharacterized protein n=1 Tax=Chlorella ohadii TaxID=2649997 RepID=A0AAD5H1M3_9CHLO|nr:hypothetical protein COHA_010063 [Chlorella ohadii]
MYQDSSESDIDSELERQSHARSRRRGRGGAPKPRIVWHPEMHAEFEAAVEALGGAFHATPKAILEHMGGDGAAASLTLSNVKSHLQRENLKCLQALHALHLAQMELHLDTAQRLKEQVGPTNEDWPSVEVKQEQKDSAEAIQEVLAAARLGGASPARGEGSAEGSQPDSPSNAADPPAAAMEE